MKKIRVILVDDHVIVREGTRELISRQKDMEVVGEAGDGEEAIELVSKLLPDVVIMDIALPKLNGIEATKRIKALHPSVAILILTAYDNEQYILSILEAGSAGYLLKNIHGSELINAIREVYTGEFVLYPAIARKVIQRFKMADKSPEKQIEEPLTTREIEVLKLAAKGMSNKEIANSLFLSARTVQAHFRSIFNKLQVGSRTEAVLCGLKRGWITLEETL